MKTIKTTLSLLLISSALVISSCGDAGSSYDENQTRNPKEFYELYKSGHKMMDGNKELDKKKVVLEGKIERVTNSTKLDGTKGITLGFNKKGDGVFAKSGIKAFFTGADQDAVKDLKVGDQIKFEGIIEDFSFDELEINNAKVIK